MPVEIRELIIRGVVRDDGGLSYDGDDDRDEEAAEDRQRLLVEECVKQVLQVLRRSRER
jgi:hypothetical protein